MENQLAEWNRNFATNELPIESISLDCWPDMPDIFLGNFADILYLKGSH